MRQANVYYKNMLSGVLTESDEGYEFCYLSDYLSLENAKPVSLTLPLQEQTFKSSVLFPFFGLTRQSPWQGLTKTPTIFKRIVV